MDHTEVGARMWTTFGLIPEERQWW